MHARRGIIIAATVTALASLALPAHAGDITVEEPIVVNDVTAAECVNAGGTVMDSSCVGGSVDGAPVSG